MKIDQVRIRAIGKLIAELKHGQYVDMDHSAAIICTDEPISDLALLRLPNCRMQFIDTEKTEDPHAFTHRQAHIIGDFLSMLPDNINTLFCCCNWGQSRSAGLAAACMTAIGQDYESVFRSRSYTPNMLVYTLMCETLGCLPSADRLQELKRLRREAGKSDGQTYRSIKRIVVTGDASLFPVILEALFDVPVEARGKEEAAIPCTEKDFVADKNHMGPVLPGDLLLVILGVHELRAGIAPEKLTARLRKYLLWLRYIYPGNELLLALPGDSLPDTRVSREQLSQLGDCCRSLAENLQIPFIHLSDRDRHSDAQSLAEYLGSAIKKEN